MPDSTPKPSEAIERVRRAKPDDVTVLLAEYDRLRRLLDEVKAALEPCVRWSQADRVLRMDPLHLKPMAELHARLTGDSGAAAETVRETCPVGKVQVEFVISCSPRQGAYGWEPTDSASVDVCVDGIRYLIQECQAKATETKAKRPYLRCPYCLCDVPLDRDSTVCDKPECQAKATEAKAIYERLRVLDSGEAQK